MKIAIVHDDFMQYGGAERVVSAMAEIWPDAPIFCACYNEQILPSDFPKNRLVPSFIQRLPFKRQLYRHLFFLHPLAFEKFYLNEFDVVISSTTRFAKSIITQPHTLHICYCNTPPRFLWFTKEYLSNKKFPPVLGRIYRLLLGPILSYLRLHDYVAAQQVDVFIGNSKNVATRIKKFYQRDAEVVYPFVDLTRFASDKKEAEEQSITSPALSGYFLIVSRLGGHKRVDLAVQTFNRLGWLLKIIGEGPEKNRLQQMAGENIEFLGNLTDAEVIQHYRSCRAFIYPQEEDFGITALEAQAAGKPVIAYRAGGALETIIEGKTGYFFAPQTTEALMNCLNDLDKNQLLKKIDPDDCKDNALRFSREKFKQALENVVISSVKEHMAKNQLLVYEKEQSVQSAENPIDQINNN